MTQSITPNTDFKDLPQEMQDALETILTQLGDLETAVKRLVKTNPNFEMIGNGSEAVKVCYQNENDSVVVGFLRRQPDTEKVKKWHETNHLRCGRVITIASRSGDLTEVFIDMLKTASFGDETYYFTMSTRGDYDGFDMIAELVPLSLFASLPGNSDYSERVAEEYGLKLDAHTPTHESAKLNWVTRLSFVEGMLFGVHKLHELGWVHLDIKPENFLIREGRVVLIDYGSSELVVNGPVFMDVRPRTQLYAPNCNYVPVDKLKDVDIYQLCMAIFVILTTHIPDVFTMQNSGWTQTVEEWVLLGRMPQFKPFIGWVDKVLSDPKLKSKDPVSLQQLIDTLPLHFEDYFQDAMQVLLDEELHSTAESKQPAKKRKSSE